MAARKAVRYITVGGTTYAPGDEVPADAVELVDNPAAWEDPNGKDASGDAATSPAKKASAKKSGK